MFRRPLVRPNVPVPLPQVGMRPPSQAPQRNPQQQMLQQRMMQQMNPQQMTQLGKLGPLSQYGSQLPSNLIGAGGLQSAFGQQPMQLTPQQQQLQQQHLQMQAQQNQQMAQTQLSPLQQQNMLHNMRDVQMANQQPTLGQPSMTGGLQPTQLNPQQMQQIHNLQTGNYIDPSIRDKIEQQFGSQAQSLQSSMASLNQTSPEFKAFEDQLRSLDAQRLRALQANMQQPTTGTLGQSVQPSMTGGLQPTQLNPQQMDQSGLQMQQMAANYGSPSTTTGTFGQPAVGLQPATSNQGILSLSGSSGAASGGGGLF